MAYAEKIESYGDTNWYLVDQNPIDVLRVIPGILEKLFLVIQAKKIFLTKLYTLLVASQTRHQLNANLVVMIVIVNSGKTLQE